MLGAQESDFKKDPTLFNNFIMKKSLCIFALLAGATYAATEEKPRLKFVDPSTPCRRKASTPIKDHIKEPLQPVSDIPDNWVWNDINGVNYLTNIRN